MAAITFNIAAADIPDALAAIEQVWAGDAVRLYFAGDRDAYNAAARPLRAKACVGAWVAVTTKNYRTEQNQRVVASGTEPSVT